MNKLQILHLCGFFFVLFPLTSIFGSLNSGLVAWYPLDGDASDSSSGNHGTLQGATPCDTELGSLAKLYYSMALTIKSASYQSSISSSSFSYSLWAKPTSSTSTYGGVITFRRLSKDTTCTNTKITDGLFGSVTALVLGKPYKVRTLPYHGPHLPSLVMVQPQGVSGRSSNRRND